MSRQSRRMSVVEAITNTLVGYVIAILTQITIFPWFDIEVRFSDQLVIGMIFMAVSMARNYAVRRGFEWFNA
jgi:hypothetical protein